MSARATKKKPACNCQGQQDWQHDYDWGKWGRAVFHDWRTWARTFTLSRIGVWDLFEERKNSIRGFWANEWYDMLYYHKPYDISNIHHCDWHHIGSPYFTLIVFSFEDQLPFCVDNKSWNDESWRVRRVLQQSGSWLDLGWSSCDAVKLTNMGDHMKLELI